MGGEIETLEGRVDSNETPTAPKDAVVRIIQREMVVERFARAVERSWNGWKAGRGHVKHVLGSRNAAAACEDVAASEKKVEKRPPTTPKPYALFVKDRFHLVRRQHPLDDFQQTAARLGELWRKMGREEKERYTHLARVGWEKQAAAWFAAHPKRKPSPYANFVKVGERSRRRTKRTDMHRCERPG